MRVINFSNIMLMLVVATLVGCAYSPEFKTEGIDTGLTPQQAKAQHESLQGSLVLWGGVIISSNNLKDSTQLEILSYPLDTNQRPVSGQQPQGRFLAIQSGYLETNDFAVGRIVTIRGSLEGNRSGRVGEAEYIYPVVNIKQMHLWKPGDQSAESRVQFGFGLMIHN